MQITMWGLDMFVKINVEYLMNKQNHSKRARRDLHFLNTDGMVACNPRDREAAHRAEMEGIATENIEAVTCQKCWEVIRTMRDQSRSENAPSDNRY